MSDRFQVTYYDGEHSYCNLEQELNQMDTRNYKLVAAFDDRRGLVFVWELKE